MAEINFARLRTAFMPECALAGSIASAVFSAFNTISASVLLAVDAAGSISMPKPAAVAALLVEAYFRSVSAAAL